MIRLEDIEEAIAECQGQRDPNAQTCIKLAAFYTIKDAMFGSKSATPPADGYSFAAAPASGQKPTIHIESGSDFARAANGMDVDDLMDIIDELMSVLQATNPPLFDAVLRKMR